MEGEKREKEEQEREGRRNRGEKGGGTGEREGGRTEEREKDFKQLIFVLACVQSLPSSH